jgi:hypothetical protein
MFECKRIGVEEGQTKGPQTIEKAKQGSYVARTVSGLQRVAKRDGSVAAVLEDASGVVSVFDNYYGYLRDTISGGMPDLLKNIVLTIGVISNHGNWFTRGTQNKEMRVLAQSYDWLLFLTDSALAEFIETTLQGNDPRFKFTRQAFADSYAKSGGQNSFTKVTINRKADEELSEYFRQVKPWSRWFSVIAPSATIEQLQADLDQLQQVFNEEIR